MPAVTPKPEQKRTLQTPELFLSFRGRVLDVSVLTHEFLLEHFPEVDLPGEYREADAWLWTRPRRHWPKNTRRFLVNWMAKAKHFRKRNEGVEAELHVGTGPEVRGT
jgi:hypothetical protein